MNLLYEGSVKNVLGPLAVQGSDSPGVLFEYTDAYSVFDWGKMPDLLPQKGEALAILAATLFERLESKETWDEFLKKDLKLENPFGNTFLEIGEKLKLYGLPTHYMGVWCQERNGVSRLSAMNHPVHSLAVKQVSVVRPTFVGSLPDYKATKASKPPRLVPLEVIFRFSAPPGSSFLERVKVAPGAKWDFPILELFTKLEPSDRLMTKQEALEISGLSLKQLDEILIQTAWVALWLKHLCAQKGMELADGKLEWGVFECGKIFLVDAIGPDELRILKDGLQLSKEFLRAYYRKTPWYPLVLKAKKEKGPEWKKEMHISPPKLPLEYIKAASQLYQVLTNELCGRIWFSEVTSLDQVMEELRRLP